MKTLSGQTLRKLIRGPNSLLARSLVWSNHANLRTIQANKFMHIILGYKNLELVKFTRLGPKLASNKSSWVDVHAASELQPE